MFNPNFCNYKYFGKIGIQNKCLGVLLVLKIIYIISFKIVNLKYALKFTNS